MLTACQTSGEFGWVPGWGLNDGGAEDKAESLSDPDKSYKIKLFTVELI